MISINWKVVESLVKSGHINVQKHPYLDLWIYNYSQLTQFEWLWTPETLLCRGLIVDTERNIIARGFSKFFTYEQLIASQESDFAKSVLSNIGKPFKIYDKKDGSLCVLFKYEGRNILATRGSFTSDQAKKAHQILESKYSNLCIESGYSYLLEIVYPENRIVVDYGTVEDLFLLGVIDSQGNEIDIYDEKLDLPFPKVKQFNLAEFQDVLDYSNDVDEGFVIKFNDNSRIKIKFARYKQLHKLLTGTNEKTVWEMLSSGHSILDVLESVPDEFYSWIKSVESNLRNKFAEIEKIAQNQFKILDRSKTRKELAREISCCEYPHIMFKMLDRKDYTNLIWKMIKPKSGKCFKIDDE